MEDRQMYATSLEAPQPRLQLVPAPAGSAVPYCFILDDAYNVVMAGPSNGEDPLATLYQADSEIDALPGPIDRVVRALTAAWRSSRPANTASAAVNELQVTVAPLHGYDGRHIAVFVQRSDAPYKA